VARGNFNPLSGLMHPILFFYLFISFTSSLSLQFTTFPVTDHRHNDLLQIWLFAVGENDEIV
jgi:hypothetical protein